MSFVPRNHRQLSYISTPVRDYPMNKKLLLIALTAALALGSQIQAQSAAAPAPVTTQRVTLIKVKPGQNQAWLKLMREVSMKTAQVRADAGEIISWTVLSCQYPAGEEARSDYMISEIFAGNPKSGGMSMADQLKAAGITMTQEEINAKRRELSHVVAMELWRPRIYNGSANKGDYLTVNHMKVLDAEKYAAFERNVWSPLSQEWIKQGAMTGWFYATKLLPTGTDTKYTTRTVDMYPSLEAVFADRKFDETFAKAHPGKKMDETMADLGKLRELGSRELWRVVERVTKKQ